MNNGVLNSDTCEPIVKVYMYMCELPFRYIVWIRASDGYSVGLNSEDTFRGHLDTRVWECDPTVLITQQQ